jgi:adenine deaminase
MSFTDNILAARGEIQADLVLKNCRIVNTFSGEIEKNNIAIKGNKIVGIGDYDGKQILDVKNKFVAPGFIDAHLHTESSMVTLPELTKVILPKGTTTIVTDPHELANVMGLSGITYILELSRTLPLNVFLMLPSCVPATNMETSGAELSAEDLNILLASPKITGLAELMNFPGVLFRDKNVIKKISMAHKYKMTIDGHAPGLSGKDLNAYIGAGISSDHECTNKNEALEKLNRGMYIMVREGTSEKNLEELVKIITPENSSRFLFATDDRHPNDLMVEGHINFLLKKAVSLGLNPITAIKMATINACQHFKFRRMGAIAPGYFADLVILNNLKSFNSSYVIKNGKIVAENGELTVTLKSTKKPVIRSSVNVKWLKKDDLKVSYNNQKKINVIGLIPEQIVTKKILTTPKVIENEIVSDINKDILKIVVVERHRASGNIGVGFVKGFGINKGAIATSVAHDSHNIIAVGSNDDDLYEAIIRIIKLGGGMSIVQNKKVLDELELPIAGLISDKPMKEVKIKLDKLNKYSRQIGCKIEDPFMVLSFLALPVIPELKITDKGLFDVTQFKVIDL